MKSHIELKEFKCQCLVNFDTFKRFSNHFKRCVRAGVAIQQGVDIVGQVGEDIPEDVAVLLDDNVEENDSIESVEIEPDIDDCFKQLLLKLLSDSLLSRKKAITFIQALNEFSSTLIRNVKFNLKNKLSAETFPVIDEVLDKSMGKFVFKNEAQVKTYLSSAGLFHDPEVEIVDNQLMPVTRHGERVLAQKPLKVAIPCLKLVLKQFFERENLLDLTIENINKLKADNSGRISNHIQGEAWQERTVDLEPGRLYLPLNLYNDDFEPDNPLGAHKGKNSQCAFYLSCPVIPNRFRAKLTSLIPCMFMNSKLKNIKPQRLFYTLIQKLKAIQSSGIDIKTKNGYVRVFPILSIFSGDNLSLNYIGGFTTSFRANHYCRSCTSHKNEMDRMVEEDESTLRNLNNYASDANKNNLTATGIKFISPFQEIEGFNVINALNYDPMHDFGEGICPFSVALVLSKLISTYETDNFTLDVINKRKNLFDYGIYKISNIPEDITVSNLDEQHLTMSSCEIFNFVDLLPMMIGDLIPDDDATWNYFLCLRKVINMSFKPSFNAHEIIEFKNLITCHHQMFRLLFDLPFKPKMHFLLHYPMAIRRNGPLHVTDSRRGESKNREVKQYARTTFNRKSLSESLMIKQAYKHAQNSFLVYKEHDFYLMQPKTVRVGDLDVETLPEVFLEEETCQYSKAGYYDDIKFNIDTCFKIDDDFVKTQFIIQYKDQMFAAVKLLDKEAFCEKMQCNFVNVNSDNPTFIYNLKNLNNFPQTVHKLNNGKLGILEPKLMH